MSLVSQSRSIAKSFENALPKDSSWLKDFRTLNSDYAKFKQASRAKDLLRSVFSENPSSTSIRKFADDPARQKRLSLAIGKEGADEISEIARDLKKATDAIKKIPAKELTVWDKYLPLSIFLPGYGKLAGVAAIPKYVGLVRRAYGYMLTTPKARKAYHEAIKSIISNNLSAYQKAASEFKKEMELEE